MKHILNKSLALLLALLMVFDVCQSGIAFAVEEADKAVNPTKYIELTVPERLQDGGNWFFIPEQNYAASEKSAEKIYIPIQRTGDLDAEAEITLKVVDVSARHDENYAVEIYKAEVEPQIILDDVSIKDIALNADGQEEFEPATDENELGELIEAAGGAELVDGDGNMVATITATPLDENGNPITEPEEAPETEQAEETAEEIPGAVEETDWTEGQLSPTELLREGRETFTGTVSDRQELSGGNALAQSADTMTEDEYNRAMADATVDSYPGKEYRLHFNVGEEAKFLVISPMYSPKAEGDAQIMLMLKDPGEGFAIGEDVNPVSVTIYDEDEPETVTVSMAADTVYAENGKATVTVTREGRLNAIKGVHLATWGGSAKEGDEYSGVGANLYFPVGIRSRSVDIPVYHGDTVKDFYVTITALTDETVERATVHVVIPAAGADGALMDDRTIGDRRITSAINIKSGWIEGDGEYEGDYGAEVHTPVDKPNNYRKVFVPIKDYGYAYDGVAMDWWAHANYCEGSIWMSYWKSGSDKSASDATCAHNVDFNSSKNDMPSGTLWNYFGTPKAPAYVSFEANHSKNRGTAFVDSTVSAHLSGMYLLKRKFEFKVEDAEVKPLIGLSDQQVLNNYEAVFVGNSMYNEQNEVWLDEAFAITQKNEKNPLRLVGMEAKTTDGKWVRIVTIDGKSMTANLTLSADNVNWLASLNVIDWQAVTVSNCNDSYKGVITVRPVFDYISAAVELAGGEYGNLKIQAPNPTLLWDFNFDNAMSAKMGVNWPAHQVSYTGGKSGLNGADSFYLFTASGSDPYISMETPVADASTARWVKIRARNGSSAKVMQLFASVGSAGRGIGNTRFDIPIENDNQWHEYVVEITNANWKGVLRWLRLDPLDGCSSGESIDIDYVAFFPDETSARTFRSGDDWITAPGTYTYHKGDVLSISTEVNDKGYAEFMTPDGFYRSHNQGGRDGVSVNSGYEKYRNDKLYNNSLGYALRCEDTEMNEVDNSYYYFEPTFTEDRNRVTVVIPENYYNQYLDTGKGIFKKGNYVSIDHDRENKQYIVVVDENILTNEIYELAAYTKNPSSVIPKWTTADGREYFGDTFYVMSKPRIRDNVITLTAASGSHLTYVTLTGYVTTSTFNLATRISATDSQPVENALVSYGGAAAWTDENGQFTLPGAIYYDSDATIRFTVTYNGVTTIHEANVPSRYAARHDAATLTGGTVKAVTANAGTVKIASYSDQVAHVDHVEAKLDGMITGGITGLTLNGKRLTVKAYIAQGEDYAMNGKTYSEHVKDVTLYFQNQTTGEVHGVFSSNIPASQQGSDVKWSYDDDAGLFTLRIDSFDPEHPGVWTYGDVLMIRLTTDRRSGVSAMTENQSQKQLYDMEKDTYVTVDVDDSEKLPMQYIPVSTGLGVYADPNYKPKTFQYDLEDLPNMLKIESPTNEDGELLDDDTRYSFGSFPFIGEITAGIHVFTKVVSSAFLSTEALMIQEDLGNMAGSATSPGMSGQGYSKQDTGASLSVFFNVTETLYGGVRFMIGMVMSYGGGKGYESQKNPYRSARDLLGGLDILHDKLVASSETDLIVNTKSGIKKSDFGGTYFKVMTFLGLYMDFGYVEISKNGGAEVSHDMIFMGAGGFVGFNVTAGFTKPFIFLVAFVPVPAYFNLEAGIKGTVFLGSSGNPQTTLQSFYEQSEMKGQDFSFNFEFQGRIYATGTIGVGIYKVIGARVTAGVGFEFGYSNNVTEWWPKLFDSGWGYTIEATFAGTLDLIFTSIDVYSASWPTPWADGFLYYFQELRRANKCILYVQNGLNDEDCDASAAAMAKTREMVDELKKMVDADLLSGASAGAEVKLYDVDTIKDKTAALKDYAYESGIISWVAKNTIEMNKQGGIVGSVINAVLQDDDPTAGGFRFRTNPHVNSRWVADNGELMATYAAVKSSTLVEDAYAQPSSKIISIGGNRFLMVFLDDTATRDKMQAATLKWTVYDAGTDTWTTPQTVQNDATADGRPHLADAGDKIILSWASATDEKYDALRYEVARENGVYTVDPDTNAVTIDNIAVQDALEADPARVMSILDIFTVEFDKSAGTFGAITQLTDDAYYDDYPQAVYDSKTGDYIVIYNKSAQDSEAYDDNGEKLLDLLGNANPGRTYSVVCYMLYNNQTGAEDTNGITHEPGWARDYLFPKETSPGSDVQAHLERWGGQRFLSSPILTADGKYADPPINDLTVAPGYNGLAAYAFTVDKDFDLSTAEDRELYVQFYDFASHSTYVPIKVGGTSTVYGVKYDSTVDDFVPHSEQREVEVGTPKLIRNGGSTFLFWREDGETLKYLNISEMLNARVTGTEDDHDGSTTEMKDGTTGDTAYWRYAVRNDGAFATDADTGEAYTPNVQTVDFGSAMTDGAIHITDYEVVTDEEDNLYVVWTDAETRDVTNEIGETYPVASQEIYASALIHQDERITRETDTEGNEIAGTAQTVRWSKPSRLTNEYKFNDGLALAVDADGNLVIVHNEYAKLTAQSEAEALNLIREGKLGVTYDKNGNAYAPTLSYNSPVNLVLTRYDKVGSLEVTRFVLSDDHPVAGETVAVAAAIENVGLTNAEGYDLAFYAAKDGERGMPIYTFTSDETIVVNTAKGVSFNWTVPADGPEGYSIQAVVKERGASGYYDPIVSSSEPLAVAPKLDLRITEITQEGDQFRVNYEVRNEGNAAVPTDTAIGLNLVGLYGDLDSERYGNITERRLYTETIGGELPVKQAQPSPDGTTACAVPTSYTGSVPVDIPASIFRYCGYDAVQLVLLNADGTVADESDQAFVAMAEPMHLALNDGDTVTVKNQETQQVNFSCDSTVFIEAGTVVYTVEDPAIAEVDENGVVTGLSVGSTTLTATLLPSGRSVSVPVQVTKNIIKPEPSEPDETPAPTEAPAEETITVPVSGDEGSVSVRAKIEDNTAVITAPTEEALETIAGKTKETGAVTIDLRELPETVTAVSIPAETVKALNDAMEEGGTGLTVKLPGSTVTFDAPALASIAAQTESEPLALHVDPMDESTLSAAQKAAFAEQNIEAVFDIYLTSGDERITDFGDGRAVIAVAHEGKSGQKLSGFAVWFAAEDGTKQKTPTTAAKDSVKFIVRHFSTYVLTYSDPGACARDENCPMSAFTDLNLNAWYHDGVHWALENEIMQGYGGGVFGPNDATSRAMIVTMLHRFEGEPKVSADAGFTDVADGKWYSEAIRWAAANGIVNGYGDGTFGPNDQLTREQLAAILCRYANYKGMNTNEGELTPLTGFIDATDVSDWAVRSMRWAVAVGIINGVGNDTISPRTDASRAQVATMLMRYAALGQ